MSADKPGCPRCQLYQAEVALLRAEIAGLRASVLALTQPPSMPGRLLEIVGTEQPERLAIAGPFGDGRDPVYRVALTYRDQLSAQCDLCLADRTAFVRFFEDLARHPLGWEGEKHVASLEDQLRISCRYHANTGRSMISMDVVCALDFPSFDPYWTVQLHLDVDPAALKSLAIQARVVFADTAADRAAL